MFPPASFQPEVYQIFACIQLGRDPINLKPVFGSYGKPEDEAVNKSWSKWTPSGHIYMSVTNPDRSAPDGFG
jgi:hypothetical protein